MKLPSAMSKTTAAWAAGSGSGGLDTGTLVASAWYYIFLIKRLDTGAVDVCYSRSATVPTYPAGYTVSRRIGCIYLYSNSTWMKYWQDGDMIVLDAPSLDANVANPGTTAVLRTLSVPPGVRVKANIIVVGQANNTGTGDSPVSIYCSDPNAADIASAIASGAVTQEVYFVASASGSTALGGPAQIWTNTSAQIRTRVQSSAAGTTLNISTIGWFDPRGKDA
jgi:hypothetical protein